MVAGSMVVYSYFELYRYKKNYGAYEAYTIMSETNWWKFSD